MYGCDESHPRPDTPMLRRIVERFNVPQIGQSQQGVIHHTRTGVLVHLSLHGHSYQ